MVLLTCTNILNAYANDYSEEQTFIQNLAMFFTSFYKASDSYAYAKKNLINLTDLTHFHTFAGLNDFEGGFLSLEEIDEYGLELPKAFQKWGKKHEKLTKRKQEKSGDDDEVAIKEDKDDTDDKNKVKEDEKYEAKEVKEYEVDEVKKMKKMKSITVNIMHGAQQGKDVIGVVEIGSGKTLAFGLPILQRLLEEREKFKNMSK
nr:hypothetical protein [Tanacetum cinerariifolium]